MPVLEPDDDELDLDEGFDDDDEDDDDYDDQPEEEDEEFLTPAGTVAILERAIAEGAGFMQGSRIAMPKEPMTCRVCGCTDDRACPDGCFWIARINRCGAAAHGTRRHSTVHTSQHHVRERLRGGNVARTEEGDR